MAFVRYIRTLMVALAFTSVLPLWAEVDVNDGSSCDKAIVIEESMAQTSFPMGERWFTATTYDLPITVNFIPEDQSGEAEPPTLDVDFGCNGVYDDDIQELITRFSVSLPQRLEAKPATIRGNIAFTWDVSDRYRTLLAKGGITRDVRAYVKVTVVNPGDVEVLVDPGSRDCMENHMFQLPDTVDVAYDDDQTAYVVPMASWQEDSIRFTWTGDADAHVWLAKKTCQFAPTTQDENVIEHYIIPAHGYFTLSIEAIEQFMKDHPDDGMCFGKVISLSEGQLIIGKAPIIKPEGSELIYDTPTAIKRNDPTVFFFSKDWTATHFEVATTETCRIYFSTTKELYPEDPSSYIRYYDLDLDTTNQVRYLDLSDYEMALLAALLEEGDHYLFCQILTSKATTLTPSAWEIDVCLKNSIQMRSGDTIQLPSMGTPPKLRMKYDEWKDYDIEHTHTKINNRSLVVGMTDDCEQTAPNEDEDLLYNSMGTTVLKWEITSDTLLKIGPPQGEFYFWTFATTRGAFKVCFTAKKPTYLLTVKADPEEGGTVSGGGEYEKNTTATLTATPESQCYEFDKWDDGNIANPRTVTVTEAKTYTALFKARETTITATYSGGEGELTITKND